jgi:hypothetical protein|tara:strand:+ start:939 stop:1268 length:330 start_codon:yes stop_codon:yes gene_type:complete
LVSQSKNKLTVLSAKYALDNAKHNNVGVVTNTKRPLMSRLHDFDSGIDDDLNMISLPPKPVLIECKPIFFDTAGSSMANMSMPDMTDEMNKYKTEEGGGFLKAVGSFFG